jgi:GT2 family glycosyltransferase
MSVSVIVSNLNGQRFLPKLIATLQAQKNVEMEIIVVDRESTDDSLQILARNPSVHVLSEPPETGLSSGYAAGAQVAKYDHLFFCNEDMWFDDYCLKALENRLDLKARVGAASSWQWSYDGEKLVHGGIRFRPFRWDVGSPLPWRMQHSLEDLASGEVIPFGNASAVLIHRQMYEELGGWDCQFFLDYEDMDFFLRGWQRGWRCVTVREAKAYHAINASKTHFLANVNQSVSKRRYISARANECMIGFKTFSNKRLLVPSLVWLALLVLHLKHKQIRLAYWDFLALGQILCRLPFAWRFRRANKPWGRDRPGEGFFTAAEFNAEPFPQPAVSTSLVTAQADHTKEVC